MFDGILGPEESRDIITEDGQIIFGHEILGTFAFLKDRVLFSLDLNVDLLSLNMLDLGLFVVGCLLLRFGLLFLTFVFFVLVFLYRSDNLQSKFRGFFLFWFIVGVFTFCFAAVERLINFC